MRHWLCLLFLAWFTAQLPTVAAALSCSHEQGAAAQHWGHHSKRDASQADPGGTDGGSARQCSAPSDSSDLDGDCAFCHLACFQPSEVVVDLPVADRRSTLVARPTPRLSSHVCEGRERPNWPLST